jgi:SAM-dependent methyltransferase
MAENYRDLIRQHIFDEHTFVRATFSGRQRTVKDNETLPWRKLVIRPVKLKSGRHLQFSYFDDKKDITKNYAGEGLQTALDNALALPFANFVVQSTSGDIQVQIGKKGTPMIHRARAQEARTIEDSHDHEKAAILPGADAYLQAVGITTHDGKVKVGMHSKFRQINEFLKMVSETGVLQAYAGTPVNVLDAGCGNAYLTFALYHYMTAILGLEVNMTGVDIKADLLERHMEKANHLGWTGLHFQPSTIIDYQPALPPDMVVALHACDTATDEAIAQGIRWGSKLIVCAPCCQHNLQEQLRTQPTPQPFAPVLRHGILHERLGDLLTDSFRALILRMMGYRTDVIQFVADEHTPKNVMIRAVKAFDPGDPRATEEYAQLKQFWGVIPYLETLIDSFS